MNRYHKLILSVIFLLLCSLSMILGHGLSLLGLFVLPLVAIASTVIVKAMIEEIDTVQHHDF